MKLGSQSLAVGVDIETADWTTEKHSLQRGQFGFFIMCGPEVFEQRIVQIGWFVQDLSNPEADAEHGELGSSYSCASVRSAQVSRRKSSSILEEIAQARP